MIGEAGLDHSDESYAGEVSTSPLSLDYYRTKAREFQGILNQVDATARAAREMIALGVSDEVTAGLMSDLEEFEQKKWTFRATAEAINAGAALINSAGGRFPVLSVPQGLNGLGLLPLALPLSAIVAIGTAAALIAWGVTWIAGVNSRMENAALMADAPPEVRAEISRVLAKAKAAQMQADESPLASVANIVKWGALALGAWLAYQAVQGRRGR